MFDAARPAAYRSTPRACAGNPTATRRWLYGDLRRAGGKHGPNAVAGKPRDMYNIDACQYERDAVRLLLNVDEAGWDM